MSSIPVITTSLILKDYPELVDGYFNYEKIEELEKQLVEEYEFAINIRTFIVFCMENDHSQIVDLIHKTIGIYNNMCFDHTGNLFYVDHICSIGVSLKDFEFYLMIFNDGSQRYIDTIIKNLTNSNELFEKHNDITLIKERLEIVNKYNFVDSSSKSAMKR